MTANAQHHQATTTTTTTTHRPIRKNDPSLSSTTFTLVPSAPAASKSACHHALLIPNPPTRNAVRKAVRKAAAAAATPASPASIATPSSAQERVWQEADAMARQFLASLTIVPQDPSSSAPADDDDDIMTHPNQQQTSNQEFTPSAAVQYGIYFPDQHHYNYLQHLKPIGQDPQAVFVATKHPVLVTGEHAEQKKDGAYHQLITSHHPSNIKDKAVLESLEALEDEAYLEEGGLEDAFFDQFHNDPSPVRQSHPSAAQETAVPEDEGSDHDVSAWMEDFRQFQLNRQAAQPCAAKSTATRRHGGIASRGTGTIRTAASGMSASSMYRNAQLELLDDRFDTLLAQTYGEEIENEGDDDEEEEYWNSSDDDQDLVSSESGKEWPCDRHIPRQRHVTPSMLGDDVDGEEIRGWMQDDDARLQGMLDEFLATHSIVGERTLRVQAHKNDPVGDMEALRRELREFAADYIQRPGADLSNLPERVSTVVPDKLGCYPVDDAPSSEDEDSGFVDHLDQLNLFQEKEEGKWDVESVLSTYSNIYNHPTILKETEIPLNQRRQSGKKGRIVLSGKLKMPMTVVDEEEDGGSVCASEPDVLKVNLGVRRPKHESKEDKAARKLAVKEAKATRRSEKKDTKLAFKHEEGIKRRVMGDAPLLKTIPL